LTRLRWLGALVGAALESAWTAPHVLASEAGSVTIVAAEAQADATAGGASFERTGLPVAPPNPFLKPRERVLSWSEQPARWFVSAEFDTGFLYVRPRFSFGYGKPHASWVGIDTNPIFSVEGVAGYAGLRFDLPFVNLRVGGRHWWTFRRSFLAPDTSYTVEDIELREGPRSEFATWEAELTLSLPIGPGFVLVEAAGSYVAGVSDGYYVYEETLRVVVDPPWTWRTRLGYTLALDADQTIVVGPVLEVAGVPGRGTHVYRAGGLARVALAHDLEARGTFVPAIVTPDPLGARGADTFLLGIRYRWATGP
jgi:hypothetical protein